MKKLIMICATALLLVAVTTATGKTAELTALGSQTPSLDAIGYDAISESVLWSFGGPPDDGDEPTAPLIADKWGNLYGTTVSGGANCPSFGGCGTVFELSPPVRKSTQWTERVLWKFGATSDDGIRPLAGLLADKWGNLYGTTSAGGANDVSFGGDGTVYEVSPPAGKSTQWSERVLHSFGATNVDGQVPYGNLIFDKWGNLYGTTADGGANNDGGTVFELSPPMGKQAQWSEQVLWSFTFGGTSTDGNTPEASLIADKWGNLYGTTTIGGANSSCFEGCGTVFELSPPTGKSTQWNERVLWSFAGPYGDGEFPEAALIADKWGNFYGTTFGGGPNCPSFAPFLCGTAFELSPPAGQQTQWSERVLWNFGATSDDGAGVAGGLLADDWGNLYGTTAYGGAGGICSGFGCGTVFKLSRPVGQQTQWGEQVLWSFDGDDGFFSLAGLIADPQGNLYGTTGGGGANGDGTVFELNLSGWGQ